MANKKQKQKQEPVERQPSKQEKEMFSMTIRAHDGRGNLIDWKFIRSLCST